MSNISSYPYNLTAIGNNTNYGDFLLGVNNAAGGSISIFMFGIVFFTSYYYLYRQNYDVPSCAAGSAFITFVPALFANLLRTAAGVPFLPGYIVIFLVVLMALGVLVTQFRGD